MNTWYEKSVFYHMYPLGMTGSPRQNDFREQTSRFLQLKAFIPYLEEHGFHALYIGPLFQSRSHGYDTIDYKLIDQRLGSNQDFSDFVSECHAHHIRVVVDGVFNHTGRDFFAFQDIQNNGEASRYRDWYRGINFSWQSPGGDSFGYDAWQGHYELPCLNLKNPEVTAYLLEVVSYWIENFQIDGIRLDCANVLDFDFMRQLRHMTGEKKADFWLMGEVIHGEYAMWVNDKTLHSVTNYQLHKSLYSGHNDHNYFEIAHNVKRLDPVGNQLYTFVDNHDEDRIASKLQNKSHLFPVFLLLYTLPGIPSVYYGSEWGIEGKRSKTEDYSLRPAITIEEAAKQSWDLTKWIKTLGTIHTSLDAFHNGQYKELYLTNRQYAFLRRGEQTAIVAAVNNDDAPATFSIPIPTSVTKAENLLDGVVYPVEQGKINITLQGNSGAILNITEGSDEK